jgi:cysteine desulfurase/selenocysteine lyase
MWNYKQDFPILNQTIHGKPLVFLDSAASSQKPKSVIDAISHYYLNDHANVHRGVYELSARATKLFENVRIQVKDFINAKYSHEIIFVRGTTDGINLVASSFGQAYIKADDEIIISAMEHHSNIVPWQLLCERTGAKLKVIPIFDNGELDIEAYKNLFTTKTKIVAVVHASNVLGTINPIKEMVKIAHSNNVPVLVDGAQAFPHMPVDMQDLDCDFYVLSSHKAYGPTGVGVLYGKEKWLNAMPPYQGGGDMIETVAFSHSTYNQLPYKFEAGTPNIADVIGFGSALTYLKTIGMQNVFSHEQELLAYAIKCLSTIPDLRFIGTAKQKVGAISFVLDNIHPHDIGTVLDHEGIAIRAGHHCAMPLMERFKIPACSRASIGIYNDEHDIDVLVEGLNSVKRMFA